MWKGMSDVTKVRRVAVFRELIWDRHTPLRLNKWPRLGCNLSPSYVIPSVSQDGAEVLRLILLRIWWCDVSVRKRMW